MTASQSLLLVQEGQPPNTWWCLRQNCNDMLILSHVTASQSLLLAQEGQPPNTWCLRLVDVEPGANPGLFLRDWAGQHCSI